MASPNGQPMVAVYCASGPVPDNYLELAAEVGEALGDRGWGLVSGGGNVSMMGAVARAAREAGAWTVGVIPKALVHREVADTDADELIVTDTMRQRKKHMEARADAFLILPGGIGTLEEFTEAWTARYLGMHEKPIVILDPVGHYDGFFEWLESMVPNGFVSRHALDQVLRTPSVRQALEHCAG
ncbi:TIGR00730 family Rossman fold protein [Hoyosella rhizosphaerae]|uniref:Cytokinin riboside 5'-monophosphate phosphoribohydrolase n=1 Tax=Hoyosella rhizosphaerae TaxID=1755582 RepID=A0A916UEA4_9ACTN|nr:TIGR00730 family Rossman fold protein [Hoyosella rhizosphaerae]MBN4925605.1 TIGR00730 family Rossman fold protein [Hoyosella rhizosphaerae]GGC69338.1 cytokinin riboside 5'-monophosphate phosphoribohydrolase [Hoyosella rhizosphaerae]